MTTIDRPSVNATVSDADASMRQADYQAQIDAISKSQAMIEFDLDGTIITANDNFLKAMGYTLDEVRGRHHRIFVDEAYARSAEYKTFWDRLKHGEYVADEFKRVGKAGNDVWIQASYNPIVDLDGRPRKVVKFATDITEQKIRNADYEGQIQAISKSQGSGRHDHLRQRQLPERHGLHARRGPRPAPQHLRR
jgi:methyl-accepting chemotaxis protein